MDSTVYKERSSGLDKKNFCCILSLFLCSMNGILQEQTPTFQSSCDGMQIDTVRVLYSLMTLSLCFFVFFFFFLCNIPRLFSWTLRLFFLRRSCMTGRAQTASSLCSGCCSLQKASARSRVPKKTTICCSNLAALFASSSSMAGVLCNGVLYFDCRHVQGIGSWDRIQLDSGMQMWVTSTVYAGFFRNKDDFWQLNMLRTTSQGGIQLNSNRFSRQQRVKYLEVNLRFYQIINRIITIELPRNLPCESRLYQ